MTLLNHKIEGQQSHIVTAYKQNGNYAMCDCFGTYCAGSEAINRLNLNARKKVNNTSVQWRLWYDTWAVCVLPACFLPRTRMWWHNHLHYLLCFIFGLKHTSIKQKCDQMLNSQLKRMELLSDIMVKLWCQYVQKEQTHTEVEAAPDDRNLLEHLQINQK